MCTIALAAALPAAAQDTPGAAAPLSTIEGADVPATTSGPAVASAGDSVMDDPMPAAPALVATSFAPPPRTGDGGYETPARHAAPEQAAWYLRVALNVAALGCRDADEAATVVSYNAFLAAAQAPLAGARAAMLAEAQHAFGAAAQAHDDDAMTRLYNFFAQPTGHRDFCAAAKVVLKEIAVVPPAALEGYAAAALVRLDAGFIAFYATHDAWRAQLAAWHARHPAPLVTAPVALAAVQPTP